MATENSTTGDASRDFKAGSVASFASTLPGLRTIAVLLGDCGAKLNDEGGLHTVASYVIYKAIDGCDALVEKLARAQQEGFRPGLDEDPGYDFCMIEALIEGAIALLEKARSIGVPAVDSDVGAIDEVERAIAGIPTLVRAMAAAYEGDADGLPDRTIVRH